MRSEQREQHAHIPFRVKPEDYRDWFPAWLPTRPGEVSPRVAREYIGYYYHRLLVNRRMYHLGEIALLTLSASIPAASAAGASKKALGALGAAVVVTTGLRNIFDWRHGWARAATTFVTMQLEYIDWAGRKNAYSGLTVQAADTMLSARIEAILSHETSAWAAALTASEGKDSDT